MKIRLGFVSNSSSQSFLIYGLRFEDHDELLNIIRSKEGIPENISLYNYFEQGDNSLNQKGIDYFLPYDGEYGVYVGKSWDEVGDDQTGSQFKEEVIKILEEHFGKKGEFGTHSASWRDG